MTPSPSAAPSICSPCFADGSTGEPVHLPDGELIQGMAGSEDPGPTAKPDGYIAKHLSANGEHFVFGSTSKFEPGGNEGELSIYDRNLTTDETHVVSKTPERRQHPLLQTQLKAPTESPSSTSQRTAPTSSSASSSKKTKAPSTGTST